jgi:hypothetical protein
METPDEEDKPKPKMPPAPEPENYDISLTRKILIGIFILGFWVFFSWFQGP